MHTAVLTLLRAGLRSDGKKPSLLAERYPRAKSCIGTCEDGLTELG